MVKVPWVQADQSDPNFGEIIKTMNVKANLAHKEADGQVVYNREGVAGLVDIIMVTEWKCS